MGPLKYIYRNEKIVSYFLKIVNTVDNIETLIRYTKSGFKVTLESVLDLFVCFFFLIFAIMSVSTRVHFVDPLNNDRLRLW